VDSPEAALAAQQGGAHRVELCSDLVEGGITPSLGAVQAAREKLTISLFVLIRPRGGDFCYTAAEFDVMRRDVIAVRDAGADGVVLGILLPDGSVDLPRTTELIALARPMQVTFCRAFDLCKNPVEALDTLISMGVERVLTSGQQPTAGDGTNLIKRLVEQENGRITVLVGGGIRSDNIARIARGTGAREFHFTARAPQESPMQYRNPRCWMGKAYQPDEYERRVTRAELVRQVINALRKPA
jgi:copper homeostasis protein